MKKISKILLVLVTMLLMLSMVLTSCGFLGGILGGDKTDESDSKGSSDVDESKSETETEPFPELEIVNLGGKDILILWPELHVDGHFVHNEIAVEDSKGDVIDMAVATRNTIVERAYNVNILSETRFVSQIPKDVRTESQAGSTLGFHAIASNINNANMVAIAQESWLTDFNELVYYDESHPWWNHDLMQDLSFADARYFASGDIIYSDDFYPYTTYVNMTVSDANLIEDNYYDMVEDRKWTLEKFHTLAKSVKTADYNTDSDAWSTSDVAGAVVNENFAKATYYAAGKGLIEFNEQGRPVWQMEIARTQQILENVIHIVHDNGACFNAGQYKNHAEREVKLINGDNTLFLVEELIISERISKSENAADFKILPFPLYEEGGEYISVLNDATVLAIPIMVEDADEVGLVLSAMSRASVDTLTPAFFETVLSGRYAPDGDSVKVLEIILGSTVAPDIATVQNWGGFMAEFKRLAFENSTDFSSYYNAHIGEVNGEINNFNALMDALHGRG